MEAKMKGHLRERSPGHWAIVIDSRDPETGKRKRKWHSFRGTKREAQVECSKLIAAISGGTYVDPSRQTVAQFLDKWLGYMASQLSPHSHERYTEIVKKNLVPMLGAVRLTNLRSAQIAKAYTNALAAGRRDGKGGLSANTVVYMHRVLKQALKQAVLWRELARNETADVKPPKVERKQMKVLDADGTVALIETARDTTLFMPILLGVTTGMRRGEVAALRWRHVDLDRAQISIEESAEQTKIGVRYKPPKSGKGRTVALPASVVEELRSHRIKQAQTLLKVGIRLSTDGFVVAQADGSPFQPRSLTHAFELFLAKHKLPRVRLHDLRHTHATAMLKGKIHPKIVQERLGHSTIAITLDIYSHVLEGMQEDAAEIVDAALQAALNKRRNSIG
jgi:integrase